MPPLSSAHERVPPRAAVGLLAALVVSLGVGVCSASAAGGGPMWAIKSVALPTNFAAGDNGRCQTEEVCDSYVVTVTNIGSTASAGALIVKDMLPTGLVVKELEKPAEEHEPEPVGQGGELQCSGAPGASSVQCSYENPVPPGSVLSITIRVKVEPGAPASATNHAEVEGGEAATAMTSAPSTVANTVNGEAPTFGVQNFSVGVYGTNGAGDVQAADHPATLATTIDYTTRLASKQETEKFFGSLKVVAVQEPKTEIVDLPLGFAGDPRAAGQCPQSGLFGSEQHPSQCPAGSRVGILELDKGNEGGKPILLTIYNVVPEPGYPAEFGFEFNQAVILMRARVLPTSSGYVLSVVVPDVARSTVAKITGVTVTFFGDPAEQDGGSGGPSAFFTNPSDCAAGPLKARLEMDAWVNPEKWVPGEATMYEASATQGVSGCNLLQFNPTIAVVPETTQADTPSGYEVDLRIPQAPNVWPALATPDLRDAEVTLPEGVSVSPGAADGLVGCQERGPEGIELGNHDALGHEVQEGEELGPDGLVHAAAGHCPAASQIGTVEVVTPLLSSPLEGHVYLAQPKCGAEGQPACTAASATNGELFGLYLEAAGSGVIVKLKGTVSVNPATGRITTRFDENPQLPFSELKLKLNGGPRAPLANPQSCGEATATSVLEPWSAPESGPPATPFSSFAVTGCASPMPFGPAFSAGTLTPAAGAFSPFTLTFSRSDGQQDLSGLTVQTPPGLLGMLSAVQLCPEPQASQGTCGPQSQIGHTEVAAGAGSHPFWNPGNVFLTVGYKGQPFGLSIVTPAKAGPFNLGNVIVRAAIHVDPHTSALTVTSDPLPQIIDGVPLRIQTVNVSIDKAGFIFNPTNCSQQQITGTITGALPNGSPGSTAAVASPFAARGCKNLPFKPKFTVLTQAKTSKANGAYLHVKVASGPGQANIGKVKVDLPKQLPSRLTTLQKACIAAVFETNPANCPAGSVVGTGTAVTPVLKNILTGPAYLVSHGGAAFPDLEIVLQGEGITLDLVGNTDIKKGITSSTFKSVPDAPISTFDLVLPEGPHSALAAYGNLCKSTLNMPTALTGQNGGVIKQTTKIAVSGCPKPTIEIKQVKVTGDAVLVTVVTSQQGTVTVSGSGLKTIKKTLAAGAHQLKVSLTKNGRTARKHHKKTKVKASVKDSNGSSSKTMTLKL
jgi:hypothetical protein